MVKNYRFILYDKIYLFLLFYFLHHFHTQNKNKFFFQCLNVKNVYECYSFYYFMRIPSQNIVLCISPRGFFVFTFYHDFSKYFILNIFLKYLLLSKHCYYCILRNKVYAHSMKYNHEIQMFDVNSHKVFSKMCILWCLIYSVRLFY